MPLTGTSYDVITSEWNHTGLELIIMHCIAGILWGGVFSRFLLKRIVCGKFFTDFMKEVSTYNYIVIT